MTKKTIIIGIATLAAILLVILIIFYIAKKRSSQSAQNPSQISSQTSVPVLPGSETAKVDTQNISQSVQENISKAETSNKETLDTKFQDMKNQSLPLEQFKTATNITIKPEIYDNLSQTDYSVFTCDQKTNNAEGLGFITQFKTGSTAAYYDDLYKKMDQNLANWEETMFSDIVPLLFPGKKISQRPSFKSAKYTTENGVVEINVRYANVKSDDGTNLSIDYAVFEENIYIFNNPQCLRKALDKYEPVLEP